MLCVSVCVCVGGGGNACVFAAGSYILMDG